MARYFKSIMKYQIIACLIILIEHNGCTFYEEYADLTDLGEFNNNIDNVDSTSPYECEESTVWTMNCYSCVCKDGRAVCSKEKFCKWPPVSAPKLCKPYTKFYLDSSRCQACECNGDGLPVCTFDYYQCAAKTGFQFYDTAWSAQSKIRSMQFGPQWPVYSCPRTTIELSIRKCKPGTQWFARCYWCTCNAVGQPWCDRLHHCSPPSTEAPARCRPGSHPISIKCPYCFCNDDGNPQANVTRNLNPLDLLVG